jgi:hypothetical protein
VIPRIQQAIVWRNWKVEWKCPVFWQHSEKCDVYNIAVLSCGMQYTVMEIMAVCVTFTLMHEVTFISGGLANLYFWWGNLRERPLGRSKRRREGNIEMDL